MSLTIKNWKCLLIVCMIPLMFGCSKSKFSAAKTPPATVGDEQVDQPSPDTPYDDDDGDDDYNHDDPDHPCQPGCNHPCKQPPKTCPEGTVYDGHGHCKELPKTCPPGYEYDGHGKCVLQCPNGRDNNGYCKPCPPPPPQCKAGYEMDMYGKCHPVCKSGQYYNGKCLPECQYGYTNDYKCKPKPPVCHKNEELGYDNKCHPIKPVCHKGEELGYDNKCHPVQPVCPKGTVLNEYGQCEQQCDGSCNKPKCYDFKKDLPEYDGPRAMNVWVVMDGSKSNAPERYSQLVGLVNMYEKTIGRKMPITISVIAGHSPESPNSVLSGKTVFYPYNKSLSEKILVFKPGMSTSQRQTMVNRLQSMIQGMQTDNSEGVSDGGELLVANLFAALSNDTLNQLSNTYLDSNKSIAVFGHGNLFNIHFVGDENDICTIGHVEDFNKITVGGKTMSREEYAYKNTCSKVTVDGKTYDLRAKADTYSKPVFDRLMALKKSNQVKLELTGFLYTGEHNIPGTDATNENEVGHGMVELIDALGGKTYDLAALTNNAAIEQGATELMEHINAGQNLTQYIKISDPKVDYNSIDLSSTYVKVDDEQVRYTVDKSKKTFKMYNCPMDGKTAYVHVCIKPKGY